MDNIAKITVTLADGSTKDFVAPVEPKTPDQTVTITAGQTVEVVAQ